MSTGQSDLWRQPEGSVAAVYLLYDDLLGSRGRLQHRLVEPVSYTYPVYVLS